MYVPNYIPDQLEVPGNITLAPYGDRVAFIRRVTVFHFISLLALWLVLYLNLPGVPLGAGLLGLTVTVLTLDVLRILLRGKPVEARLASGMAPFLLLMAATVVQAARQEGWPIEFWVAGPTCALIYTLLCGRDYSFIGCLTLSAIASTTAIAVMLNRMPHSEPIVVRALLGNLAYLTYFVYDLASLMARRRRGEEVAAVVDLYRDVFNIFGYLVRVIKHWRKHRIWIVPR